MSQNVNRQYACRKIKMDEQSIKSVGLCCEQINSLMRRCGSELNRAICSGDGCTKRWQRVLHIGTFIHHNVSKIDYEIKSTQHYCPLVETVLSNIFQYCQFRGVHLDINSSYQMVNLCGKFIFHRLIINLSGVTSRICHMLLSFWKEGEASHLGYSIRTTQKPWR